VLNILDIIKMKNIKVPHCRNNSKIKYQSRLKRQKLVPLTANTWPLTFLWLCIFEFAKRIYTFLYILLIGKRNVKQWWSTLPPISTKQTITSHLKRGDNFIWR